MTVPDVDMSKIKTQVVTDSPAVKDGVVTQIGEPWVNTTIVTSTSAGKVSVDKAINKVVLQ